MAQDAIRMSRNQRQGEDKFVFDQFHQIESTRKSQHVVVAFGIEFSGLLLSLHEAEAPIDRQIRTHRLQTPLADQPDAGIHLQRQPDLRAARPRRHHLASRAPDHRDWRVRSHVRMHLVEQSAKDLKRMLSLKRTSALGKGRHVQTAGIEIGRIHLRQFRPRAVSARVTEQPRPRRHNRGMPSRRPLILASSSVYRRELLARLGLPFTWVAPDTDETPIDDEPPGTIARRLAKAKALAVAITHPQAIVIGSDQVAMLDGCVLDKPGHFERARLQLMSMSGRQVQFHTAVSVMCMDTGFNQGDLAIATVDVRRLTADEIERYLRREQPYDCAGSAKCEGLGIALLERIESDDPTALIGLPLIRTCALLREAGIDPLGDVIQ